MKPYRIRNLACAALILQLVAAALLAGDADATIKLYDDRLILSGFAKETMYYRTAMMDREKKFRDNGFDMARSTFYLEALYTVTESPDLTMRLFGGMKYWYEASHRLDEKQDRYIAHRMKKDYVRPRSFDDDVLTEAYVDIFKGPWELRAGKQIVIWGQLDVDRVADVVNPLDFRWNVPGIDNWEEVKKGLWMLRGFYTSQLPGNLLFEGIFNPGYFQEMNLPYTGTHWGPAYSEPFGAPGIDLFSWQQEKWHRDAPTWNLRKNYEFGFRVQGYTYGIDWTLLYWNGLSDGMVVHPSRTTAMTYQYIFSAISAASTGKKINPGDWPDYKVAYYKRMETFGGTAQYCAQKLHGSVWRLEWFYNRNVPFNRGGRGAADEVTDWTRRDMLGYAVSYSDKFTIPGFTRTKICTGKQLDVTITYTWDKIYNNSHDLYKSAYNHRPGDATAEGISLFLMQMMFNGEWTFVFIGNYKPRIEKWFGCPTITYTFPGLHWRVDMGYKFYGARRGYCKGSYYDKDAAILRIRYEF